MKHKITWRFIAFSLIFTLLVLLFVVWTGWYIVFLALLLIPFILLLRQSRFKGMRAVLLNSWVYFPLVGVIALSLAVLLRIFVLSVYGIPSGSMENTILPGDQVLVSKLPYGPRMPASPREIPWYGLLFRKAEAKWPAHRLPGTGSYERSDIMVFEREGMSTPFIKRCAGLPGDTLVMAGWRLYVNGKRLKTTAGIKHTVSVYFNDRAALSQWYEQNTTDWRGQEYTNGKGFWRIGLTRRQMQELQQTAFVDSVLPVRLTEKASRVIETEAEGQKFPVSTYHEKSYIEKASRGWEKNFFGPLVVPYKGMRIALTSQTAARYRQAIETYEGDSLSVTGEHIKVNGEARSYYTFQHNYYFMLGDNRDFSSDSRYWGFIPEQAVLGKAIMVLFNSKWTHLGNGRLLMPLKHE